MNACMYCAGTGDLFDKKTDDWVSGEKCPRCEGWGELGRAVDEKGKFCGLNEETGRFETMPPEFSGYCGANCKHCENFKVYVLSVEGVWVCAADYEEG